eukprot:GFKZ01005389.1.p5 GENE.GFKZ01005389.1~~GFKZ01005389.1.p5  ORF type:complete len:116 (-),score=8.18 GFKZ01005389.1:2696-3043(-)
MEEINRFSSEEVTWHMRHDFLATLRPIADSLIPTQRKLAADPNSDTHPDLSNQSLAAVISSQHLAPKTPTTSEPHALQEQVASLPPTPMSPSTTSTPTAISLRAPFAHLPQSMLT